MHKSIKAIAVAALTLTAATAVHAQGQWVDKYPIVPTKDTIALDIWRYACAQF